MIIVSALAAFAAMAGVPGAPVAAEPACSIPSDTFEYEPYLPRTLTALQSGKSVTIVAIGGASTKGRAAGDNGRAWPARLGRVLAARFPTAKITVLNQGVARESAGQMVARFDKDVLAFKPDLVIWETGTNDAVSATDVDAFRETLQAGIERLRGAGPEVMLMNPQFSRLSEFVVNFNRYTTILRGVADLNELPLFPRHEIMRYWAESGVFNYRVSGREQRRELATQLYACIGTAVADMIVRYSPGQVR
jgi:hypothetical protein